MNEITVFWLIASVSCSTARAVFSKRLGVSAGDSTGGRKAFYKTQALLFFIAAVWICVLNMQTMHIPSAETAVLGILYGILTVLAQWLYTVALGRMPVSVCATVYSFGFIIPTVFGTIVWHERITFCKILSVGLCIAAIRLSSARPDTEHKKTPMGAFLPLMISMVSSGCLGIIQKLQQRSTRAPEVGSFLFLAFLLSAAVSLAAAAICAKSSVRVFRRESGISIVLVGTAMAVANTANTLLAGRLPSVVVFPITNVGVILLSSLISVFLLKEKLSGRQAFALFLGVAAIILFNF